MKNDLPNAEDLGPLARHRSTLPAVVWTLAVLSACLIMMVDGPVPTDIQAAGAATVVAKAAPQR